jgi:tetratricopeptide (TPR) repeat protein/TolB-like protein
MIRGSHSEQPDSPCAIGGEADRLDSWKEIANFFRREVRTVQLWERHEYLPVHRHHHRKVGTVHAYKPELEEWWKHRCSAKMEVKFAPHTQQGPSNKRSHVQPQITLSILPFCVSQDKTFDKQSTGSLTDRIVERLDSILHPRLRVIASLTAAQRHAEGFKPEEAHGGPDADYALAGSVLGCRDSLQIQLRLKRMKDQIVIWSRSCEYRNADMLETVSDLTDKVASALSHHVLLSRHPLKYGAVNPAARYAYLRGRYLWSLRSTPISLFSALEQFRLATELDPDYASAFSGLADCYAILGWFGAIPRETAMKEARRAAQRALALDGFLAEAHVSLGYVHFNFDWDWDAAERELILGIDLNPSYAQAYCWYGLLMVSLGRSHEAIHAAQVAQEMDPASPVVGLILGNALFHAEQHEAAILQFEHVLRLHPNHAMAHCRLGLAYEQAGKFHPAIEHLKFAAKACSEDSNMQSTLAYVYARAGKRNEAEALLSPVVRQQKYTETVPAFEVATAFTALGDHESAFRYLYSGFEQRDARLTGLKCDPRLQPLHTDPRFDSLARQMRLA